jgi:hypothetical protein
MMKFFSVSPRHVMLSGMIAQVILGLGNGYVTNYLLHLLLRCSVAATCSMMCIGIMIGKIFMIISTK